VRRRRFELHPVRYFRGRLHRRLFGWFGIAILVSFASVAIVMQLFGRGAPSFQRETERAQRFIAHTFADAWDDAAARRTTARRFATDLDLDLEVRDAHGAVLDREGPACVRPALEVPVTRDGDALGTIRICADRHRAHALPLVFALFAAAGVLWGFSGKFARRFLRPIAELARVAEAIGSGSLGARAHEGCRAPGEVGVLVRAVNDMAARIEKQLSDQRELLAGVSHEIRTPLARIRLLTELARDGAPTERTLDELDREVVEIDRLVGELLASSRLDFTALSPTRLDARDVAARALDRAGLDAALLRDASDGAEIHADPTLLARALANLLDNARQHGSAVTALSVRAEDGAVAFEVDDRGPGLEPGDEARIFDSFYRRASTPARDRGSLGLGLALVRRIAEAHGGRAYASSKPEGGARVGFSIPLRDEVSS
jgi:signal transduction histidine kinase